MGPSLSPRTSSSPSSGAGIVMRFKCSSYEKNTMDVPPLSTYKQRRPTSFDFRIKHFASFCNKYLYHVVFIINEKLQWLPQRFLTNFWESPAQMKSDAFYVQFCFLFLSVSLLFLFFNIAFLTLSVSSKLVPARLTTRASELGKKKSFSKLNPSLKVKFLTKLDKGLIVAYIFYWCINKK